MSEAVAWLLTTEAEVPEGDRWLTSREREAQTRYVVPKRRNEWRSGRWAAKGLLEAWLPVPAAEVAVLSRASDDGFPLVRGAGVPGPRISISHCGGLAIAAVARPGVQVGCDLERVEPRPPGFALDWFTAEEQQRLVRSSGWMRDVAVTLTWSVKEAALKAVGEGLRVDTRTVRTRFAWPPSGSTAADGGSGDRWSRCGAQIDAGPGLRGWWGLLAGSVVVVLASSGLRERPPARMARKAPFSTATVDPRSYSAIGGERAPAPQVVAAGDVSSRGTRPADQDPQPPTGGLH